jgi:branched-subunit amino acid transport protein AzlD
MPDASHVAASLAVAVAITVSLRALPFAMRTAMSGSALLVSVDHRHPPYGLGELVGVAVTAAVHLWRHNAALSIVAGTSSYLLISNVVLHGG